MPAGRPRVSDRIDHDSDLLVRIAPGLLARLDVHAGGKRSALVRRILVDHPAAPPSDVGGTERVAFCFPRSQRAALQRRARDLSVSEGALVRGAIVAFLAATDGDTIYS